MIIVTGIVEVVIEVEELPEVVPRPEEAAEPFWDGVEAVQSRDLW